MSVEAELNAEKLRYRALVEQLPLVTYVNAVACDASPQYVSPQIEALLGYPLETWLAKPRPIRSIIHQDDLPAVVAEARRHEAEQTPFRAEYRVHAADGRIVWLLDQMAVVHSEEGRPLFVQGVLLDVSERKQLEEQLAHAQKMDAIGRLAGGIAHDFNNLLHAIIGHSDMALSQLDGSHAAAAEIRELRRTVERAAELTRRLLAFGRHATVHPQVLELGNVVHGLEPMLHRLIPESIELCTSVDDGVPLVEADPTQLEQVVLNLVVNARDAMPAGGRLSIGVTRERVREVRPHTFLSARPGDYARLAVSDTGEGIDAATQARIFEPFFTTKAVGRGSGLGLSMVYAAVESAGGFIRLDSAPGRGTAFDLYFPACNAKRTSPD
jgi:two-component system cell cycle sensor histidine kinase/response regulator CckA